VSQPFVSICIPVYYSGPEIPRVLDILLTSIEAQDYPRIHTILSIQACDEAEYVDKLSEVVSQRGCTIFYPLISSVNGPAENTNSAIAFAAHDGYTKIMNQDDFLDSVTTISEMVEAIETSESEWLVNSCIHTDSVGEKRERLHVPSWPGEKGMVEGINRIGCPSVSMFKTKIRPECDTNLVLCLDCDMWIQLYRKAGAPVIRNVPDVVIRMWDNQLSNQINYARSLEADKIYMRKKYGYT